MEKKHILIKSQKNTLFFKNKNMQLSNNIDSIKTNIIIYNTILN